MIFTTKKGKDLWQSLWWARSQAGEHVVEAIRGVILALLEANKFKDQPYHMRVELASAHAHDAYYQGKKWDYDFDATLLVCPGKRYYVQTLQGKVFQHVFEFLDEPHSPFKVVPGKGIDWTQSFEIPACDRDIAGALFAASVDRIIKSPNIVYPAHYRTIKTHVFETEGV